MAKEITLYMVVCNLKPTGIEFLVKDFEATIHEKTVMYKNYNGLPKILQKSNIGVVNTKLRNELPTGLISYYTFTYDVDDIDTIKDIVKSAVIDRFNTLEQSYLQLKKGLSNA